eukprot:COSAG02_NODE_3671_length_6396_cov_6.795935_5_plen_195_part_00
MLAPNLLEVRQSQALYACALDFSSCAHSLLAGIYLRVGSNQAFHFRRCGFESSNRSHDWQQLVVLRSVVGRRCVIGCTTRPTESGVQILRARMDPMMRGRIHPIHTPYAEPVGSLAFAVWSATPPGYRLRAVDCVSLDFLAHARTRSHVQSWVLWFWCQNSPVIRAFRLEPLATRHKLMSRVYRSRTQRPLCPI